MRWWRLAGGVAGDRAGGQRAAQLSQVFQRAVQQQPIARFGITRGSECIAQFLQGLLLESQAGFQVNQSLFEFSHAQPLRTERPRPMP